MLLHRHRPLAGRRRLFGTTDLHAENIIACGPVPVVVDCETLFTPGSGRPSAGWAMRPTGRCGVLLGTVLSSGLLPGRGSGLGWRGVDISAGGALNRRATGGTRCRAGSSTPAPTWHGWRMRPTPVSPGGQPAQPRTGSGRYWPDLLDGFEALTAALERLDRAGRWLPRGRLRRRRCPGRPAPTESYSELARMLWHPVSLHDEPAAVGQRCGPATAQAGPPRRAGDPGVSPAEIADLLQGDIPFFATTTGAAG